MTIMPPRTFSILLIICKIKEEKDHGLILLLPLCCLELSVLHLSLKAHYLIKQCS